MPRVTAASRFFAMFNEDRTLSPSHAWRNGMIFLRELGLSCDQPEPSLGKHPRSYVVPTALFDGTDCISEASGKGIDWQAWASGLYEAFEHAATAYKLPGQSPQYFYETLPQSPLQNVDLIYRFARRVRADVPQPVVEFEEFVTTRRVLYPAVAADFGYTITPGDRDLGYLDRTSTTKGYASGSNRWEAEVHALNELIEHDALSAYLLSAITGGTEIMGVAVHSWPSADSVIATITRMGASDLVVVRLPSLVSTVILAWCRSTEGAIVTGIGCSSYGDVAVMRALTETHQELVAERLGASWATEGGMPRANLGNYPVLYSLAVPPRPTPRAEISVAELQDRQAESINPHPGNRLLEAGYRYLSREVWATPTLSVVQVLIPGAERFADIDLGRPLVPTGRLASPDLISKLLRRKTPPDEQ